MQPKTQKVLILTGTALTIIAIVVIVAKVTERKSTSIETAETSQLFAYSGRQFLLKPNGQLIQVDTGEEIDTGVKGFDVKYGLIYYIDGSVQDVSQY